MKQIPSPVLVSRLKELVARERAITVQQIGHLEEIDRRKCYFDSGHSSLWDFMIQELGLSSGSAQRRKDAMRLTREEPSVKENLLDGSLTLTNAAKVQAFCRRTGKKHGVRELVDQVTHLTQDDCTRKLFAIAPEALPQERLRVIAPEARELRVVISDELHQKLERIKGLLAHAKPNPSYAELLEHLADQELKRLAKIRGLSPKSELDRQELSANANAQSTTTVAARPTDDRPSLPSQPTGEEANPTPDIPSNLPPGQRVHLPKPLQRQVWREADGKCQLCTSTYRLEIDHIVPLSQGGANARDNLRLLCRAHNQAPRDIREVRPATANSTTEKGLSARSRPLGGLRRIRYFLYSAEPLAPAIPLAPPSAATNASASSLRKYPVGRDLPPWSGSKPKTMTVEIFMACTES